MSQEDEVSATIPIGLGGRQINIYFYTGAMTAQEWNRFAATLATLRDALVADAPKPVLGASGGEVPRHSGVKDDKIIKLGAGGDYGRPLPAMDTVSVTTDLRTPTDTPCVCGHIYGMHHYSGMCATCGNCAKFTEDVGVPE
jgi:hypothetical protein